MNLEVNMKKLTIVGAGGYGKVVADIAIKNGYEYITFVDDNPLIKDCYGFPVVGTLKDLKNNDTDIVVAIGNATFREKIMKSVTKDRLVSLAHPNSVIAEDVTIGPGTIIMAGAVINPGVKIGCGCIVNTSSSIDHDCLIEDFVHVAVGAHIAGTCFIGKKTWIGAGAILSNNTSIISDVTIGAGTVVIKDIKEPGIYVGVPAERIEKEDCANMKNSDINKKSERELNI